ncbi:MAG: hypothetical protein ACXVH1_31045 [Solirubrobacteraceae bacterium]
MSLAIAYTFAGLLAAAGIVISGVLTGSAMSTTAIGTVLPVMRHVCLRMVARLSGRRRGDGLPLRGLGRLVGFGSPRGVPALG